MMARLSLTLMTHPGQSALEDWAQACLRELRALDVAAEADAVLSQDEALDITLATDAKPDALRGHIAGVLAGQPVDFILQDAAQRRKRLLIADMESTIIEQEMLEEMAEVLGKRAEVAAITRRAMNGEMDFTTALLARVGLFAGMPATLIDDVATRMTYDPGAAVLVATMRHNGAVCWLASGGFRNYTQRVAQKLGFDRECANELLIADGLLTGGVAEPILDRDSKLQVLRRGITEIDVDYADTVTVGDGANDLAMLQASSAGGGLGVAYHAKPSVRAAATHALDHVDLCGLLFAQGYRRQDFILDAHADGSYAHPPLSPA